MNPSVTLKQFQEITQQLTIKDSNAFSNVASLLLRRGDSIRLERFLGPTSDGLQQQGRDAIA